MVLRFPTNDNNFTSAIIHHERVIRIFKVCETGITYANDSWVIRHDGRLVLLDRGVLLDPQILDVAAAEDDVFVDLVRRRYLLFRPAFAALCAERADILERHG